MDFVEEAAHKIKHQVIGRLGEAEMGRTWWRNQDKKRPIRRPSVKPLTGWAPPGLPWSLLLGLVFSPLFHLIVTLFLGLLPC